MHLEVMYLCPRDSCQCGGVGTQTYSISGRFTERCHGQVPYEGMACGRAVALVPIGLHDDDEWLWSQ